MAKIAYFAITRREGPTRWLVIEVRPSLPDRETGEVYSDYSAAMNAVGVLNAAIALNDA